MALWPICTVGTSNVLDLSNTPPLSLSGGWGRRRENILTGRRRVFYTPPPIVRLAVILSILWCFGPVRANALSRVPTQLLLIFGGTSRCRREMSSHGNSLAPSLPHGDPVPPNVSSSCMGTRPSALVRAADPKPPGRALRSNFAVHTWQLIRG